MPRSLYKKSRGSGAKGNQDPLLITKKGRKQSSYQVTDYLFCGDCEHRVNVGGEHYVLSLVAKQNLDFPLLHSLNSVPATLRGKDWEVYSEAATPAINRNKIAYFALSVFWRASVHTWEQENGEKVKIDLGPKYNEEVRRYLMNLAPVPKNAALQVTACSDQRSRATFFAPEENQKHKDRTFIFVARGILFFFRISNTLRDHERRLSIVNSTDRWITVRDCSKNPVWFSPEN